METNASPMSVEEFLELVESSPNERRYEYFNGLVREMPTVSWEHALLATNLTVLAGNAARAGNKVCHIIASSVFVRIEVTNAFCQPDLFGVCEPEIAGGPRFTTTPCFIIEILSPSTERFDRREKLLSYLTLPSLDEYVIVSQDRMRIEVFRRATGPMKPQVLESPDDVLELSCIDLRIALKEVYYRVPLGSAAASEPACEAVD